MTDGLFLLSLLVLSRLIPHWPNFTALGAVAILAPQWGRRNPWAIFLPLCGLLVSDFFIGYYSTMIFTYGAVFVVSCLSHGALFSEENTLTHWGRWSVTSSLLFYAITNFGSWWTMAMYPKNIQGLLASYINGLPFLGFDVCANLFFMGVALWAHSLWNERSSSKAFSR